MIKQNMYLFSISFRRAYFSSIDSLCILKRLLDPAKTFISHAVSSLRSKNLNHQIKNLSIILKGFWGFGVLGFWVTFC